MEFLLILAIIIVVGLAVLAIKIAFKVTKLLFKIIWSLIPFALVGFAIYLLITLVT